MNKKIYIAGKVTGLPPAAVKQKFAKAEDEMKAKGYEVYNPVTIVGNPNEDWYIAMRKCLTALLECDTILLLKDWRSSSGACLEFNLATQLKFTIVMEK
jgi:hypothetical protein